MRTRLSQQLACFAASVLGGCSLVTDLRDFAGDAPSPSAGDASSSLDASFAGDHSRVVPIDTSLDRGDDDASDSSSSSCSSTPTSFCEDFDNLAGLRVAAQHVMGGAALVLLSTAPRSPPKYMNVSLVKSAAPQSAYLDLPPFVAAHSRYELSFAYRAPRTLATSVRVATVNLTSASSLSLYSNGGTIEVVVQGALTDGGTFFDKPAAFYQTAFSGNFGDWHTIKLSVNHALRTLTVTVDGLTLAPYTFPSDLLIGMTSRASSSVGVVFLGGIESTASYDLDDVRLQASSQ